MQNIGKNILTLLVVLGVVCVYGGCFALTAVGQTNSDDTRSFDTTLTGEENASDETNPDVPADVGTDTGSTSTNEFASDFRKAESITLDQKVVGTEVTANSKIFYKIGSVAPGDQLVVSGVGFSGTTDSEQMNYIEFTLYDSDGVMLSQNQNLADGKQEVAVYYYPGKEKEDTSAKTVYMQISASSDLKEKINSYEFTATKNDLTDADSKEEAGETISAGPVTVEIGSYAENYLGINKCGTNKYCSTDEADTFKFSAQANTKLTLDVTPVKTLGIKVTVMDVNGDIISDLSGVAEGEMVSSNITSYEDRDLYFSVSPLLSSKIKFGSYEMTIASEAVEPIATTEEQVEQPSLVSRLLSNQLLIYLGIAVIAVIIILIIFFGRPKRGKGISKKSEEGAEVVRKALKHRKEVVMPDTKIVQSDKSLRSDLTKVKKRGSGGIERISAGSDKEMPTQKAKSSLDLETSEGVGTDEPPPQDIEI